MQAQAVPPPPAGLVVVRGGGGGGGHDFEGGCGGSGCCCLWVVGGWVGGWSRACCGHSACACSCSAEGCPTTVQIERQGVGPARGLDTRVAAQHKERRVPCGVGGWVVARRGRGWARAQHTHTGCSGGAPPHTQIFRGLGPFGRPKTRGAKGEGAHPHARVAGSAGRGLRCAKGGVGGGARNHGDTTSVSFESSESSRLGPHVAAPRSLSPTPTPGGTYIRPQGLERYAHHPRPGKEMQER